MKKLICLTLTFAMLMSSLLGVISVAASNSFGWTASSASGNTAIDSIDTIKGSGVAFRAWGTSEASMIAEKVQSGAYAMCFSVAFPELKATRIFEASGIEMLVVDKDGAVKSGSKTLSSSIELNKWNDVEIVVYPGQNTYTVSYNDATESFTAVGIEALESVKLLYTDIAAEGTTTLVSDPIISAITVPDAVASLSKTEITWSGDSLSADTATGTRTYYYNYSDTTGAERGSILALEVDGVSGGEFRSANNNNSRPAPENLVEFSFDYYVPEPEMGQTTPSVDQHQLIGNGWNTNPRYYYFVELDHSDKELRYKKVSATNYQSVDLDYEYGAWYTCKIYLDYNNDMCYIRIIDSDGNYIGGAQYSEDLDAGAFVNSDTAKIVTYSVQINFRDTDAEYVAFIDNYGFSQWGTDNAVLIQTIPYSGKINAAPSSDFVFKYEGSPLDVASLSTAVVKANGTGVDAQLTAVDGGFKAALENDLASGTDYTISVEGIKDIRGNALSAVLDMTTSGGEAVGNLSITEGTGFATASVKLGTTTKNLNLYGVVYDSDGSMADYTPTVQAAGTVDDTIEAPVTASYSGGAAAYLWDDQMNIVTPAITTVADTISSSDPCAVTISKLYDPIEKFVIKGTAKLGAAMKLYSVINKDTASEVKELIYVKEVSALANGYFETSFESNVTGDVELVINTQDGSGIQTVEQRIYSPAEAAEIIDNFNYLDDNPTYDGDVEEQYNLMVDYYDTLIKEHYQLLGINLSEYVSLSKYKIAEILLASSGSYSSDSDVLEKYNMAVATAKFDVADAAAVEELLLRYAAEYNFATSETYVYFAAPDINPEIKQAVYSKLASKNDYEDMDDVVEYMKEQIILSSILLASSEGDIYSLMSGNKLYLSLDLSDYNMLYDKSVVAAAIKGTDYTSVDAFKLDFAAKTAAALANEKLNMLSWTAYYDKGSVAVDDVDTIKGSAVRVSVSGASDAKIKAVVSRTGSYAVNFSMLMADLNSVRKINLSGIDMLTINKSGYVLVAGNLMGKITINQWHDIQIIAHPSTNSYTVAFDGKVKTIASEAVITDLEHMIVSFDSIDTSGTAAVISSPIINTISLNSQLRDGYYTIYNFNGNIGNPVPTRQWIENADPTGRGKAKVYKHVQESGDTGEYRVLEDAPLTTAEADSPLILELNANIYVDAPAQGQTTPIVTGHKMQPKINNVWYVLFNLNHKDKTLSIGNTTLNLDYSYGQWLNIKVFFNFADDSYYTVLFDESGKLLASYKRVVGNITSVTAMNITTMFKDANGGHTAYIEGFGWKKYNTSANVTELLPHLNALNVNSDADVFVNVSGGAIDPDSVVGASKTVVVKLDGIVKPSAVVSMEGTQSISIDLGVLSDGNHTVSVSGMTDIAGNTIPECETEFTVGSIDLGFGKLALKEISGTITASVPVTTAQDNFTVYCVAYKADGSMADYTPIAKNAGVINNVVEAPLTVSGHSSASAYLWDNNMNIITPGITNGTVGCQNAEPCDVTISKTYNPDIIKIKGTANSNASIILKDNHNNPVYVKEINANVNGYFETSFASPVTGNVTLLINTQNGQGMQTINQYLYTTVEADAAVDAFNYRTDNPSYDSTNDIQYNAMVEHFDNLIAIYEKLFEFNLTEYAAVSKNDVAEILFEGTYNEFNDVVEQYAYAMAIAKFNAAANADDVEALFEQYSEAYDFELSQTYSYYNTVSDAVKSKIYEKIANKNDYSSMTDVMNYFEEQTILAAVECATINVEIESIINANNTYLQLDMTKFNSLSNPSAVTSIIRGTAYTTVAAFKSDFISKTDTAKINENNLQGGTQQPQVGGGGGGAAAYTPPKENISLPVTEDIAGAVITPDATFEDIRLVPWAEESILYLAEKGIINGKSKTHFAPSDNIKRSEFVKIITLAFPQSNYDMKNIPFDDVESGAWYEAFVKEAYSRGIINGKSEKSFGVNDNITREEIVVMLYRVAKMRGLDLKPTKSVVFDDEANIADYAKEAVRALSEAEIVSGADNMFMSKNPATRAEAAKLIYCLMQREVE